MQRLYRKSLMQLWCLEADRTNVVQVACLSGWNAGLMLLSICAQHSRSPATSCALVPVRFHSQSACACARMRCRCARCFPLTQQACWLLGVSQATLEFDC